MNVLGTELVKEQLQQPGYFFKAILNDTAAAFFPGKTEHRTIKVAGLSYEDDYRGNALAAILTNGRIEIRNHRDFPASHVKIIINELLQHPELDCLKDAAVLYAGEKLS